MKLLILISLITLVACGKVTIVGTKTINGHSVTIYSDGSTKWTDTTPAGYQPIVDLAAHKAKAEAATDAFGSNYELVKSETLMGKGWIVVRSKSDNSYLALNLDYVTTSDGAYSYDSPDVAIKGIFFVSVDDLEVIEGNILRASSTLSSYQGTYNINDPEYKRGSFYLYSDFSPRYWAAEDSTPDPTLAELGFDTLTVEDFYFSENGDSKKDLENIASNIETEELTQYGLSTKTAKMVKTLAKTAGKRALSEREKDLFAKELTGMSFDKAAEMMVEDYEGLLEKAAELNETSPEAIKELINTIM